MSLHLCRSPPESMPSSNIPATLSKWKKETFDTRSHSLSLCLFSFKIGDTVCRVVYSGYSFYEVGRIECSIRCFAQFYANKNNKNIFSKTMAIKSN